jgi:hypothetical protein
VLLWFIISSNNLDRSIARTNGFEAGTCRRLVDTEFSRPLSENNDFTQKDLQKQYEIYICGNQYREPPTTALAIDFASEGAVAAKFLEGKLSETTSDATVRDIVSVYAEMTRQNSYDVAGDTQLMSLIRSKVSSMSGSTWKGFVNSDMAEITRQK